MATPEPDGLEDLEEKQLVDREVTSDKPFRVHYSLTERGRSLKPVITALRDWGMAHLAEADDRDRSVA